VWWWWSDYYWPMPWVFCPLMAIIIIALCMGMMWVMMHRRHDSAPKKTIDMLNEAFARGEITETQYRNLKQILES